MNAIATKPAPTVEPLPAPPVQLSDEVVHFINNGLNSRSFHAPRALADFGFIVSLCNRLPDGVIDEHLAVIHRTITEMNALEKELMQAVAQALFEVRRLQR